MQYLVYSDILLDLVKVEYLPENINKKDFIIFKNEEKKQESGKIIIVKNDKSIDLNKKYRLGTFIRIATDHDKQIIKQNKKSQNSLTNKIQAISNNLNLGVKIIAVNYSLDHKKIYIIFSSEHRIDFRWLVKKVVDKYKKPVHIQQIWPRDRARIIWQIGKCGLPLCCKKKNWQLPSITMITAKNQWLFWGNNTKFIGRCNKLMCCLEYEENTYKELSKGLPKIGEIIKFQNEDTKVNVNKGRVINLNVLSQQVFVEINFINDDGRKIYRKIIIDKGDIIK